MATFFETGVCARVNGTMLQKCPEGSAVCVVGQVKSPGIMHSSDGVELRLEGADDIPQSGVVEVVGTKLNGSCIKIMRGTSLGDDFALSNYEALVQLINGQYANLFSAS